MGYAAAEIVDSVRNIIGTLTVKHNITAAYIFGSFSKGNPSSHSDIDIAVVLDKIRDGSPFDEAFEIFHEVQKQNSLCEVICFTEKQFLYEEEEIIKHIKRDGIKIY